MSSPSRRAFLGTSLAAFTSGRLLAADSPAPTPQRFVDDAAFQPSTLFLTWQRDPTTTMTVQWVGARGETADPTVYYAKSLFSYWDAQPTTAKWYAETDL